MVLKCRHKATGQIVAIKRFKESDDDEQVKKTALREIKILKQLRHENIVSLLEVFRVKGKLYLVFEFVERTILEEIEKHPDGLDPARLKTLMWQLLRAISFCHQHNIIHRDIKPENLLVSRNGVLKLCDFGFARPLAGAGAKYTEYVSTRWYRAPELLVGDVSYGKAVDVWSIGCMFAEIATGLPLFPGDSDIDQLYHIIRCLGKITPRQQELFRKNSLYVGVKLPQSADREPLESRFPQFDGPALDFIKQTIRDEPLDRWTCSELLSHSFFGSSHAQYESELQAAIAKDLNDAGGVIGGGIGGINGVLQKKKRVRKPKGSDDDSNGDSSVRQPSPVTITMGVKMVDPAARQHDPQQLPPHYVQKHPVAVHANNSVPINHAKGNGFVAKKPSVLPCPTMPGGQQQQGSFLPTLQQCGTMNSSASSSSTSSVSTMSINSDNGSPKMVAAPPTSSSTQSRALTYGGGYPSKKLTVPSISESRPSAVIPAENMAHIQHFAANRQAMTSQGPSNGGRFSTPSGAAVTPYSFANAPPNPPPSISMAPAYVKSPYASREPSRKAFAGNGSRGSSHSRGDSCASPYEVYSPPKKARLPSDGARQPAAAHPYVPPRTSHASVRGGRRRDTDTRHF